jgi:heme exporter protein D
MKKTESELILLSMLRQKQYNMDIYYLTTDCLLYKALKVLFYILFVLCTGINILCSVSWSAQLGADLSVLQGATSVQSQVAAEIRGSITTVVIFGALLFVGALFTKYHKSIPAVCFSVVPSAILLYTFYNRLSEAISTGHYAFFVWVHAVPLGLLMLCSIVMGAIEISQNILDKKGMEEVATEIYEKYSVLAEDISDAQWNELLNSYKKPEKKKKVKN